MVSRRCVALFLAAVALSVVGWSVYSWATYPSDRTPLGAYLRIMSAVNRDRPEEFFAYLETATQHACYTIRDYRRATRNRVLASYPEPERSRLAASYAPEATAKDGQDVFAVHARRRGWLQRLRRDLSGADSVQIEGERATLQTARGTRYPFRRRENGIWGLTLFTATLVGEAEKASRDALMIERAAADYDRARRADTAERR
ncbi:MAG: hypothetical protein JW940_33760 [Polyangiaceae bacterium]|nr:hypothetical protein [Polyangiaceae bacterium]